jgi:hypothetical protein
MDADTLNAVVELGRESGPRFLAPPPGTEPPNVYYKVAGDRAERVEGVRLDRHVCRDIDTVVRLAKDKSGSALWYSRTGVIAHHPDGDRATLALSPHPTLVRLIEIGQTGGKGYDQATFYRMIRTTFRDALGSNYETVRTAVRSVNLRTEQTAAGVVDRQKVSMSRSIVSESTGPELPDVLHFFTPVFDTGSIRMGAPVRLSLDLDPSSGQFTLTVLPGEIEEAFTSGERDLLRMIEAAKGVNEAADIPVYFGQPG